MTTTGKNTTISIPQMILYLSIVAVIALLNSWTARAGEPEAHMNNNYEVATEPELEIEDWMLNFSNNFQAESTEDAIEIEDWMLDFSNNFQSESTEDAIEIEDWMLNFNDDFLAASPEDEIRLEPWMTNHEGSFTARLDGAETETLRLESWMLNFEWLEGPVYYADIQEEEIQIEDWMLGICCWDISKFLVDN